MDSSSAMDPLLPICRRNNGFQAWLTFFNGSPQGLNSTAFPSPLIRDPLLIEAPIRPHGSPQHFEILVPCFLFFATYNIYLFREASAMDDFRDPRDLLQFTPFQTNGERLLDLLKLPAVAVCCQRPPIDGFRNLHGNSSDMEGISVKLCPLLV